MISAFLDRNGPTSVRIRQLRFWVLFLAIFNRRVTPTAAFGLFKTFQSNYVTAPLSKNNQQAELREVTNLFVESFWQGKVGGGARQLTDEQRRMLESQQWNEFRTRYASSARPSALLISRDRRDGTVVACAGVEVDTVPVFLSGRSREGGGPFPFLGGIPDKPSGRDELKMQYAPLMSNVVVSRDYRRKGIAELMVKEIERVCRDELDYDVCFLYVEQRNQPAVKLYQKLGYKILWKDAFAKTIIPKEDGSIDSSATVILCMKKELGKGGGGGSIFGW